MVAVVIRLVRHEGGGSHYEVIKSGGSYHGDGRQWYWRMWW
jgi:hypothetical protein